jgi:hypothetical protein
MHTRLFYVYTSLSIAARYVVLLRLVALVINLYYCYYYSHDVEESNDTTFSDSCLRIYTLLRCVAL